MAVVSISADNTRLDDAEASTGWSNFNGGGPSPASEPQLKYQGSNAVNRKVTATNAREGVAYTHGSGTDMTAAANRLFLFKGYVADFGDTNSTWGVEGVIGSSSGNYYSYNLAGSGANRSVFDTYPAQGGYLIAAIDPNISGWRESTTGTPSLTGVLYFAIGVEFVSGGAKSENVALDAIDIGTGLTLTGGDGGDADGVFQDFLDADQGTANNRWGYVTSVGGTLLVRGMLTIGTATATVFTDPSAVVVFPDGYHSAGLFGVTADLQNASTAVDIGSTLIGRGSSTTEDTRPDFIVSGTTGTLSLSGTLSNFRNVTLTSACTADGAEINPELLTQGGAEIQNSRIVTNSLSGVGCIQDPTFGSTSDIHDCDFVEGGAGHAFEFTGTGTHTLTNLTYSGYGADTTNSAAIFNDSGGSVTLNIVGGDTPTVRDGTSATTTINISNSVTITAVDTSGTPIENARVFLEFDSTGDDIFDGSDGTSLTDVNGQVSTSVSTTGDVTGRVRKSSATPFYKTSIITGTISGDFSQTIVMILDE